MNEEQHITNVIDEILLAQVKPKEKLTRKKLNLRHLKVLELLLDGKAPTEALKAAGYKPTNRSIITRIRPELNRMMEEKKNKMAKESMSKDECIKILKGIALNDKDPALQIRAIETLSKLYGYYAPIQAETKNMTMTMIRMIEDDVPKILEPTVLTLKE